MCFILTACFNIRISDEVLKKIDSGDIKCVPVKLFENQKTRLNQVDHKTGGKKLAFLEISKLTEKVYNCPNAYHAHFGSENLTFDGQIIFWPLKDNSYMGLFTGKMINKGEESKFGFIPILNDLDNGILLLTLGINKDIIQQVFPQKFPWEFEFKQNKNTFYKFSSIEEMKRIAEYFRENRQNSEVISQSAIFRTVEN